MTRRFRVMVVDDSALVRETLREILSADPELEVIALAPDPFAAAERLRTAVPDVLVLDLEMPRMDGLTFLRKLMRQHPIPTVICSTLAIAGSSVALAALEAGAVDLIAKPTLGTRHSLEEQQVRICDTVKAAARARRVRPRAAASTPIEVAPKLNADAVLPRAPGPRIATREKVVVLGASTGGTEAIRDVLDRLPADAPGIAIVQHMPEGFTAQFAQRLDRTSAMQVREAATGDTLTPGVALIAPGNHHLALRRTGQRYHVEVLDGPLVCRHRPSVDVLFRSAAQAAGANAVGVLLTGMGDDGARGLLELKQAGAATVAQDEATSVVFGMPQEAIKRGAADRVLPLPAIPAALLGLAR